MSGFSASLQTTVQQKSIHPVPIQQYSYMSYQPPLTLTPRIQKQVLAICEMLDRWSMMTGGKLSPHLRHNNRIRTIQASLAIENNTLSVEQVTAVIEGKRVLGLPREIQEVRNAFTAYEAMNQWQAHSHKDLLTAHQLLMQGLVDRPGQFRLGDVGVYRDKQLVHMAPPASRVSLLMQDLLHWLKVSDLHPLVVSAVFHYEFEFIHPFDDGNGRMGRLWQTVILTHWQGILAGLPVETVIRDRQEAYYQALLIADQAADTTPFVEFILDAIADALSEALKDQSKRVGTGKSSEKSSEKILEYLRSKPKLSARDLAELLEISPRAVEKQIASLKKAGRLQRIGPAKGGFWNLLP